MRPNILLLNAHDLGRHLSCYGRRTIVTPALQALSEQGVTFDNSFCTAPQCSPSRAALHTGRYPHAVGMMGLAHAPFNWRLHPDEQHMAQRLHAVGYETALIGNQHLTESRLMLENPAALGFETALPDAPARELAAQAAAFLSRRAEAARPFYLEVGFVEPHRPYDWGGAQPDDSQGVSIPPYIPESPEARADFAALQGIIRVMDEGVGIILRALQESGLADNTWVIFTTDHGVAMPRAKCTLYDPGIETALIMHWPGGGLTGGRRVAELVSHVDMAPTMLDALGLPIPDTLHGRSYWPLLQGRAYEPRREVFAEKTYHTMYEPMRGIRTATHKLIVNFAEDVAINVPADIQLSPIYPLMLGQITQHRPHVELYALQSDPWEQTNIAGAREVAEVERDLKRRLFAWMEQTGDPLLRGLPPSPYYHETMRQLRGGDSDAA
ncbi:MAG: sulfatase [Anaerolineae bacterium]